MSDLYRLVTSGNEFRQYELFWTYHGVLPEGVTSVVVDDDDEAVEFFVPVIIDYEAAKKALLHRLDVYEIDDDLPNETLLADDVRAIVDAAVGKEER